MYVIMLTNSCIGGCGSKHSDFCCFSGVTYVALTLCFKLKSFLHCAVRILLKVYNSSSSISSSSSSISSSSSSSTAAVTVTTKLFVRRKMCHIATCF